MPSFTLCGAVSFVVFDPMPFFIVFYMALKGLKVSTNHVIVSVLTNVRKAKAVKNNMATSPGVPITFSINVTHAMPCCPPGLKMLSCIKGVSISVNATEVHTIVKKVTKNHFHRLAV